jgi:hypothetical protein
VKSLSQKEITIVTGGYTSCVIEWASYYVVYEKCKQMFPAASGGGISLGGLTCFLTAKTTGYFIKEKYKEFTQNTTKPNN